ncbi:MAG: VOC family protein [Candidatus Limnocylindria bacterium]
MIQGIDHLVIVCADPDAAAADLESSVGLVASGGGRHAGMGTFNRIAWLADGSYLELIGIDDAEAARSSAVGSAALATIESTGEGLVTWALRVDDLELTVASLPEGSFGPVLHGSRTRPDGEAVEWWTAMPDTPLAPDATPFLIQHAYVGTEWGHTALADRAAFQHPIGSPVGLARLDLAATDPPGRAATFHEHLGIDVWAVADLAVAEIGRHVVRFVPRREMAVPAVVTLAADIESPRTAELLGLGFEVERAELLVPEPHRP